MGFFPCSTLNNLMPVEASSLLRVFRAAFVGRGLSSVGMDLRKDTAMLVCAYDDAAGATATFNLDLLVRINRELGGNFDLRAFKHTAVYNALRGAHRDIWLAPA